jgi:hypothetical protein
LPEPLSSSGPWVADLLVNLLAIEFPVRIGGARPEGSDLVETPPTRRRSRNEPDAWPPRDRDGHVFAALGSPDELSCPLSEFAKSERRHTSRVGPALLDAYPSADEDELWATVRAAFSNLGISDSALPAEGGAFDLSDEALNTLHAALSTATTAC